MPEFRARLGGLFSSDALARGRAYSPRALQFALLGSALLHLAFFLAPRETPPAEHGAPRTLQARLQPRPTPPVETPPAAPPSSPQQKTRPQARQRVLSVPKNVNSTQHTPKWSVAEKNEMDRFLNELEQAPKPSLAQRSLAMAREQGRQMAAQDDAADALLELRPNAPPVHPFSLESYLDGMVRRLNQSSSYVRRERHEPGVRPAMVQFRLNPDGSLKSFTVVNPGDQAGEIAFIRSVVERSIPFAPFPPDIDRAARSLGVTICIRPAGGDAGLGFSRMRGNRC